MANGIFTMVENPVPWPNGARCAVSFTYDVDADSILHIAHPDDADSRILTMTDLRYGPNVAIPRICRAFESRGIKVSFFIPGWCAEEHPKAVERMLEGGHEIAPITRLGGYYELADGHPGPGFYELPAPLAAARGRVDLATPLDFAATLDIIGGNSGSPVVDRRGDFVGVVFDGNLWGLPNRFAYDAERSRAITVDARAILEVLRQVYPAGHLADEIVRAAGGRKGE